MSIDLPVLRAVAEGRRWAFAVWEPYRPVVVMGRGSAINEVNTGSCSLDRIPIHRRKTGGGTVLLSPGMLVFSLAGKTANNLAVKQRCHGINLSIMDFLEGLGVKNLYERGISDICIGDRKILGSGMYLGKGVLFFQGVLLVNCRIEPMEKYLAEPRHRPEYRRSRTHRDFVTTLEAQGYGFHMPEIIIEMKDFLRNNIEGMSGF